MKQFSVRKQDALKDRFIDATVTGMFAFRAPRSGYETRDKLWNIMCLTLKYVLVAQEVIHFESFILCDIKTLGVNVKRRKYVCLCPTLFVSCSKTLIFSMPSEKMAISYEVTSNDDCKAGATQQGNLIFSLNIYYFGES